MFLFLRFDLGYTMVQLQALVLQLSPEFESQAGV